MGCKPKWYLSAQLRKILNSRPSVHKDAMEDRAFREKWLTVKNRRLKDQPFCLYCKTSFTNSNAAVLHHAGMRKKEEENQKLRSELGIKFICGEMGIEEAEKIYLKSMSNLLEYYKTLQETDLICMACHAREHPQARSHPQKKL